jgi:hypothetical protein
LAGAFTPILRMHIMSNLSRRSLVTSAAALPALAAPAIAQIDNPDAELMRSVKPTTVYGLPTTP